MDCPACESPTRVLESRRADDGAAMRRRRECPACGRRFTTFERREPEPLWVRKREGERQRFDRNKLRAGLLRATHKRPVGPDHVEAIVERIEATANRAGGELPAQRIGEMCLEGLRELDLGAYLQFAAVYRQLADPEAIRAELARLGTQSGGAGGASAKSANPVRKSSVRRARKHGKFPTKTG